MKEKRERQQKQNQEEQEKPKEAASVMRIKRTAIVRRKETEKTELQQGISSTAVYILIDTFDVSINLCNAILFSIFYLVAEAPKKFTSRKLKIVRQQGKMILMQCRGYNRKGGHWWLITGYLTSECHLFLITN